MNDGEPEQAGEEVLWEGRPRGWVPMTWWVLLCYLPPVILGFAPLLLHLLFNSSGATVLWDWKADFLGRYGADGSYSMGSAAWWIIVLMLESYRFASWRSQVYRLTETHWLQRTGVFWTRESGPERGSEEEVRLERRNLVIDGLGEKPTHWGGLDARDAEAIRAVLAQAETRQHTNGS